MHAALRNSEWDETDLHYPHTSSEKVACVFRKGAPKHEWQPWVLVGESQILKSLGRVGKGVYAARSFPRDALVGRYEGTVVGAYDSRQEALASEEARRLVRRGHDKLMTRRLPEGGIELIDGATSGPPHVPLCNDPRGTALTANAELTDGGYLRVVHARVPAFDLGKTLEQNARSELRIDYGARYWALMDRLGTSAEHALEVD